MPSLLQPDECGLYCAAGDFHIDPWRAVERAVITHAHADHARPGCRSYLAAAEGVEVLRSRLGPEAAIRGLAYGERIDMRGVTVSLHPAGHILGSAQVRVEHRGEVWVVSGDFKTTPDPTCAAFESVHCHTFICECTFGMPFYRWPAQRGVFDEIDEWWRENAGRGVTSVLFAYALGKAQRILAGVDASIGPIFAHGAVHPLTAAYRAAGRALPETETVDQERVRTAGGRALVVAPPSAQGTPWLRRFEPYSLGFASGWMLVRGARRRRAVDRGFVLSDHADWDGLMHAIDAAGAERIGLTHGFTDVMLRWLREQGRDAFLVTTGYAGEIDDAHEQEPAT